MKQFVKNLTSGVVVILCAVLLGFAVYGSVMWPRNKVTEALTEEGYTNIQLSQAFINRAPFQCDSEEGNIYTYTATLNEQPVSGFACYHGWMWGVSHWDN